MAGESPDKVERVESSGETTAEGGTVASMRGQKPGGKGERKTDARSGAEGSGTPEKSGEASGEAAEGASHGPSEDAVQAAEGSEAEAAEDATESSGTQPGDGGADSVAAEAEEASEPGGSAQAADDPGAGSEAEGEGRSDDRLKAAVAAWVAGSEEETGEGRADGGDRESVKGGAEESREREAESSQIPADGRPLPQAPGGGDETASTEDSTAASRASGASGAPDAAEDANGPDGAAEAAGEADQPTAMFRTVRPGSDDTSAATDSEEAARRAERMTAAFFGSGKTAGDGGAAAKDGKTDEAGNSASVADSSGGEDRPEVDGRESSGEDGGDGDRQDADRADEQAEQHEQEDSSGSAEGEPVAPDGDRLDDATTVFRALGPEDAAEEPEGAAADGEKDGEGRVDQPTTAFRALAPGEPDEEPRAPGAGGTAAGGEKGADAADPDAADAKASGAKAEKASGAKAEDADAKFEDADAKAAKPRDPRLADYAKTASATSGTTDAGKTDSGKADSGEGGSGKAGEAAKAGETGKAEKAGKAGQAPESDAERTSKFVPLRSADVPPRPPRAPDPAVPPKPDEKPVAGELPPEAEPSRLSEAERTRQEVRPDQAPLDLLAQLTNTPPPPETPLRTAVRRVKIWTPLAVVLVVLFAVAQAVRPLPVPELTLSAQPTYGFQGPKPSVPWPSEGQAALDVQGLGSFGTSGKQKPVPIASVAKVMTAYVILRDHPVKKGSDGAKIPVDKKAEDEAGLSAQNESTVEVKEGGTLTEREAVQAVMIASANNVARLLARWDAGSEKAFAKKMNKAAADLGMKNTEYTDPSGLTSSTVSTATDQVKLAKKAMEIDLFRETVRLPGYTDGEGEQHPNWNKLVPLDGVVGIKTGTTTKAGGNLLFAAEQQVGGTKQLIIGAVLGQYRPSILDTVLAESKKLIDTAQDSLRSQQVVQKGEVVGYVDDQLGGRTPVVASRDVSAVGWSGLRVKLGLTDGGKALPHEGKAGDRAGTLTVGDGPGQVRVPVTLKEDMSAPGFGAKLTRIL